MAQYFGGVTQHTILVRHASASYSQRHWLGNFQTSFQALVHQISELCKRVNVLSSVLLVHICGIRLRSRLLERESSKASARKNTSHHTYEKARSGRGVVWDGRGGGQSARDDGSPLRDHA
jgi:hypothetical protein